MTASTQQATGVSARSSVTAVLSATVAAIVIWAAATMAGADLTVGVGSAPPQKITVVNVVLAALVGSLAGWSLLALLRRFTPKARAIWTVIAIIAAFLSLAGPLTAIASAGTKMWLGAMHLAVATVLIAGLRRTR